MAIFEVGHRKRLRTRGIPKRPHPRVYHLDREGNDEHIQCFLIYTNEDGVILDNS
jgi:hypothetical protein